MVTIQVDSTSGAIVVPTQALKLIKTVLILVIFICMSFASVSSRLFSVIRFESIIHEFDPWFNYRATRYLVEKGFNKFLNWFDDKTWYPLGRVTGGTLYPGLMVTSGFIHYVFSLIGLPIDIRNICVLLLPLFSSLTSLFTFFLTKEITNHNMTASLLSAAFMAITPGYISRSVAGSYDNEAIAITLLMATFYFWVRLINLGSVFWSCLASIFYFYMVSAWGGYVFITNLIPLHVFVLLLMGRFDYKIYVSYSSWYVLGTLLSMQIPFVGFLPIRSNDHMASFGVFGLLQLILFINYFKETLSPKNFRRLLTLFAVVIGVLGVSGLILATKFGLIAPWTGRFYSLWDTNYAKVHIPIISSVSEHQPTPWSLFFFDLNFLIWLFPVGVWLCFCDLSNASVFVIIYSVLGSYFAGVMIRLILTLTPIVCVCGGITVGKVFELYFDVHDLIQASTKDINPKQKKDLTLNFLSKLCISASFMFYLYFYVQHCTWVTSNLYSSPSVVLLSNNPDGSQYLIDDYRELYYWLRMNTKEDLKVMSWWDYGYQIGGMADRTTLVDNNTWNNTHIAMVGRAMATSEEKSEILMRQLDVDYVLVIFGGMIGFSGDDLNKFLWMVRISEGIWPEEINERSFFTERGEYKVDDMLTPLMKNSLMYKMSFYRFGDIFGPQGAVDRVRQQRLSLKHLKSIQINSIEELYTSENLMVRIYKVKDKDNFAREMAQAGEFDRVMADSTVNKRNKKKLLSKKLVEFRE